MLSFKLRGDVLEVKEVQMTFFADIITYWYIDIKNWMCSNTNDRNAPLDRKMDQGSIDWVKKYYLPKVLKKD